MAKVLMKSHQKKLAFHWMDTARTMQIINSWLCFGLHPSLKFNSVFFGARGHSPMNYNFVLNLYHNFHRIDIKYDSGVS